MLIDFMHELTPFIVALTGLIAIWVKYTQGKIRQESRDSRAEVKAVLQETKDTVNIVKTQTNGIVTKLVDTLAKHVEVTTSTTTTVAPCNSSL